ncbi:unnamed protein product [Phytomonas sp. EM1]|nr:unnamed protein product [Phytomonas sp. EM1]|eukprot:CCW59839.1 unnamed protein product [Phytomonas sp. isolate EM1]
MGAAPSKENVFLFSFFRGSYEVGLIPLTKCFFGSEEEGNESIKNDNIVHLHQFEASGEVPDPSSLSDKQFSTRPFDVVDRKRLRSQVIQMRRDPAVLYSNARDTENMIQTIKMRVHEKHACLCHGNNKIAKEAVCTGIHFPEVGATSIIGSRVNNTKNDSHENLMSKSMLKGDAKKIPEAVNSSTSTASVESLGPKDDPFPLDIDSTLFRENFWDIMPEPNFTEEDLDNFLELVENEMYETDEDMITDPRYAVETETLGSSKSRKTSVRHDANTTGDGVAATSQKRLPRAFIPTPCALCLAYPVGKERQGCFLLEGRSINIIGYFGCMTKEMQEAFKVTKRNSEFNGEKTRSSTDGNAASTSTVVSGRHRNTAESSDPTEDPQTKIHLYFNTSVLTSAGDRTLERVLILAPVMLRQQFHVAYRRFLINQKLRDRNRTAQPDEGASMTAPLASGRSPCEATKPQGSTAINKSLSISPATATVADGSFAPSEGKAGGAGEGCYMDPLMSVAFSPLPPGVFTPGIYWPYQRDEGAEQERQPQEQTTPVDETEQAEVDSEDGIKSHANSREEFVLFPKWKQPGENHFFRSPSTSNTIFNEVTDTLTGMHLTNVEEDAITWGFIRRLNTISVMIEVSSNNYPALKSLTENFAFMHTQLDIDLNGLSMTLVNMPGLDKFTAKDTCGEEGGPSNQSAHHDVKQGPQFKPATTIHTNKTPIGETTKHEADKSKEMPDLNTGTCNVFLPDKLDDGYSAQNKTLKRMKGNLCDADGSTTVLHDDTVSSSCWIAPDSGVVIMLKPCLFRQAVLWLSSLFCHPLRYSKTCWIQYKLKDELEEARCVLQKKDMIVSLWRQHEKEKARSYFGPNTEYLLEHVRVLQEETELTRSSLHSRSSSVRVFKTQDNRNYTLHRGKAGPMLIAARGFHPCLLNNNKPSRNTNTITTPTVAPGGSQRDNDTQGVKNPSQKQMESKKSANGNESSSHSNRRSSHAANIGPMLGPYIPNVPYHEPPRPHCSLRRHQPPFLPRGPPMIGNQPPLMYPMPPAPPQTLMTEVSNATPVQPSVSLGGNLPYYYGTPQVFVSFPCDIGASRGNPVDGLMPTSSCHELPQEQPLFFMDKPVDVPVNSSPVQDNCDDLQRLYAKMGPPSSIVPSSVKIEPLSETQYNSVKDCLHPDQVKVSTGAVLNAVEQSNSALEGIFTTSGSEVMMRSHHSLDHQDHLKNYAPTKDALGSGDVFSMSVWSQDVGAQHINTAHCLNKQDAGSIPATCPRDADFYLASGTAPTTTTTAPAHSDNYAAVSAEGTYKVVMQGPQHTGGSGYSMMGVPVTKPQCSQIRVPISTQPQQLMMTNPGLISNNIVYNVCDPHSTVACMGDLDNSLKIQSPAASFNPVSLRSEKAIGYTSMCPLPLHSDTSTIPHGSVGPGSEASTHFETPMNLPSKCIDTCGSMQRPLFLSAPTYQNNLDNVVPLMQPLPVNEPYAGPLQLPQLQHKMYYPMVSCPVSAMHQVPEFTTATAISMQSTQGLSATITPVLNPFQQHPKMTLTQMQGQGFISTQMGVSVHQPVPHFTGEYCFNPDLVNRARSY